jgi:SPP1 family predicted phage head-tail adaptor
VTSAGALDRRVTIRRAAISYGTFNDPVSTWLDLITVWAAARRVTDIEQFRAQEIGAEVTARFTIRYSSEVADLGPADRLAFEGREYNITGVRELGRREWLEISAAARAEG